VSRIYADAAFYIAFLHRTDALHDRAVALERLTRANEVVTSDPVLTEVLNHFSGSEPHLRRAAFEFVEYLRGAERTEIVAQTRELFDAGLDLYGRRPDKGYGHTDCMSMVICRQHRIRRVLTHDRHFAQEGFEILL